MDPQQLADSILLHLQEVTMVKKAILQVAFEIADEYPAQASVLVRAVRGMTTSADKLLGDTMVEDT